MIQEIIYCGKRGFQFFESIGLNIHISIGRSDTQEVERKSLPVHIFLAHPIAYAKLSLHR